MKSRIARIGVMLVGAAFAQHAIAEPAGETASSANAATGNAQDDSGALSEIVVTATRREENLQHTALAITAISGQDLSRQGITSTEDFNKSVPGLGLSSQGAITQVYIRGIGNFAPPNGDSSVLVSVDQVVMGALSMIGGQFYDLSRVEVLKGPQGTLYGRNATAGAINFITNKPTFENEGDATVEFGDYHLVKFTGALNVPLNDEFAVRAAAQYVTRDGYYTDGSGNEDLRSVRLQGLYKPSDTFSVLLATDYVHQGGTGAPAVPVPFVDPKNPWVGPSTALSNSVIPAGTAFYRIPDNTSVDSNIWGTHAEMNWDLGFATLTVIPAYRTAKFNEILNPGFGVNAEYDGSEKTLETRLASSADGPLKWLVGAFYYDEQSTLFDAVDQGITAQSLVQNRTTKAYAAFSDLTYSFTDALRLVGGLRFTHEANTLGGGEDTLKIPTQPIGSGYIILPPGAASISFPGEVADHNVSGKFGFEYDLTAASLMYANWSSGFRAGGINQEGLPNTYRPEVLKAYTIGSKNRFLDNRLQANFEAFYWNYTDHQENALLPQNGVPGGESVLTLNVPKSTLKGISMDLQYLLTPNDLLSIQPEFLKATFEDFTYTSPSPLAVVKPTTGCQTTSIPPAVAAPGVPPQFQGTTEVNCSGQPFTRAPKWNATANFQHTLHIEQSELVGGVHTHVASWTYIATDYIAAERQAGYAMTDLDLAWIAPNAKWSITGYVRNVSDVAVKTSAFEHPFIPGLAYATLMPPRTYGVQFGVKY